MAHYSPEEQQLWVMLLEQQRRKRAFYGAREGGRGEGEGERDGNEGHQRQGSGVSGVEGIIADMASHSVQDQGGVSDVEGITADVPSHSMQDFQMQLMLLEQQNEKRFLRFKAQQEKEEREREREGDDNLCSPQQSQDVVPSVEKRLVDGLHFDSHSVQNYQIPPMQQSTEHLRMARRETEERERENDAGSGQQGRGVEQQHPGPSEPDINLPNPVAAPSGVLPQLHPHHQSRPAGAHKDASRRVAGGRIESHTRPQRTRGTGRERHEERAALFAGFDVHPDDLAWFGY